MPVRVKMPDGKIAEFPDGTPTTTIESALSSHVAAPPAPQAAAPDKPWYTQAADYVGDKASGVVDAAKNLVAPSKDGLLGGLYGPSEALVSMASGALGQAVEGIDRLTPGGTPDGVAEALTYRPRTETGRRLVGLTGSVVAPVADAAHVVGAVAKKIGASDSVAKGIEQIAPFAVPGVPRVVKDAKSVARAVGEGYVAPALSETVNPATALGRKMDYRFSPTDVKAAMPSAAVPGLTRQTFQKPDALSRENILHNQQVTTKEAGLALGAGEVTRLGDKEFAKLKAPEAVVYEQMNKAVRRAPMTPEYATAWAEAVERTKFEVDATPTPTQVIGALRRRYAKNVKGKDIATQDSAFADRAAADALEDAIGGRLDAAGDTETLGKYKASREQFAKIYNVEGATRASQVDAAVLARMNKKNVGLTGPLKMIAEVAEAHPKAMKHSLSTARGTRGGSEHITAYGLVSKAGKAITRKLPGLDVRTPGFQNKFGTVATPAERAAFKDYGKKAPKPAPDVGE